MQMIRQEYSYGKIWSLSQIKGNGDAAVSLSLVLYAKSVIFQIKQIHFKVENEI